MAYFISSLKLGLKDKPIAAIEKTWMALVEML